MIMLCIQATTVITNHCLQLWQQCWCYTFKYRCFFGPEICISSI